MGRVRGRVAGRGRSAAAALVLAALVPAALTTASPAVAATTSDTAGPVGSGAALPRLGLDAPDVPAPRWTSRVVAAGGVRQWIECAGSGPVTVVVIPGLHATHTMWAPVLAAFARTARTCVYDRPGLGPSPARTPHATVDAGRHADELAALLDAVRIRGPLVVVGHSYGGLVARAFAARHADRVAGLLLVEGVAPYDQSSRYWAEGGDRVDLRRSSEAAAAMRLGATPLVVEAAQDPDRTYWGGPAFGSSADDITDWTAHQRAAASLSTSSAYVVVARSAHVVEHDRPDAVIAGLRLLVRAATGTSPLPRCDLGRYGAQPLCR